MGEIYCRMQVKLPQPLPNNMLKMNLKNIVLFKTACLNQTSIKKLNVLKVSEMNQMIKNVSNFRKTE